MPNDLPEEVEQLKLLNGLADDMPIELTAGQLRKLLSTATAEAEKRERERIQKWLLDNQTLETPELGKIVLWGWIWAVVNNIPDEDGIQ